MVILSNFRPAIKLQKQNNNRFEVDYGPDIQIEHRSITNLSKPENIVVLECVHRLLRKGYSPKHEF